MAYPSLNTRRPVVDVQLVWPLIQTFRPLAQYRRPQFKYFGHFFCGVKVCHRQLSVRRACSSRPAHDQLEVNLVYLFLADRYASYFGLIHDRNHSACWARGSGHTWRGTSSPVLSQLARIISSPFLAAQPGYGDLQTAGDGHQFVVRQVARAMLNSGDVAFVCGQLRLSHTIKVRHRQLRGVTMWLSHGQAGCATILLKPARSRPAGSEPGLLIPC